MLSKQIRGAELLRKKRNELGWTQCELAEKSGLGRSTISHMESKRRTITYEASIALASRLGVKWQHLCTGGVPIDAIKKVSQ